MVIIFEWLVHEVEMKVEQVKVQEAGMVLVGLMVGMAMERAGAV